MIELSIPYPPSVNHYYRRDRFGRVFLTARARDYRATVVAESRGLGSVSGLVRVELVVTPPDRRKRDLDNIKKAALDAIVAAGLIEDDSNIVELSSVKTLPGKPGQGWINVKIERVKSLRSPVDCAKAARVDA